MRKKAISGGLICTVLVGGAVTAFAGDGRIVPDPNNPNVHRISTTVYQDLPRTEEDLERFTEVLENASRSICDYTEGRFKFDLNEFVITNHPLEKKSADIWWFNRFDRAVALGVFGRETNNETCQLLTKTEPVAAGGRTLIYDNIDGEVLAHEFGHLVFGLFDHYPQERGSDASLRTLRGPAVDGATAIADPRTGASFFRDMTRESRRVSQFVYPGTPAPPLSLVEGSCDAGDNNGADCTFAAGDCPNGTCRAEPLYSSGSGADWWLDNNSAMQQSSAQSCVDAQGNSARATDPVLFADSYCQSNADRNSDGVADDCGPRCADRFNVGAIDLGEPCTEASDCLTGQCNLGASFCTGGDRSGAPCTADADCGGDFACRSGLAFRVCVNPGPRNGAVCAAVGGDASCDDPAVAGSGVCGLAGFPTCNVGSVQGTNELSTLDNHERLRFDETYKRATNPVAPLAEGHPKAGAELVVQGFLYPTTDQLSSVTGPQPAAGSTGNLPCFEATENFAFSPQGECLSFFNPAVVAGDIGSEFECNNAGRQANLLCPGTGLPGVLMTGSAASCDGSVLANTAACVSGFPMGVGVNQCGNWALDTLRNAAGDLEAFEQCDAPATQVVTSTVGPRPGQPLRCQDLHSEWKVLAGEAMTWEETVPATAFSGGVVRCQANCLFDLSEGCGLRSDHAASTWAV